MDEGKKGQRYVQINQKLFSILTKESIPLLAEAFANEKHFAMNVSPASGKNNADVSMRSSSGKTAREISIEYAKWECYIQEMAPFYTNLVSSYFEVLSKH